MNFTLNGLRSCNILRCTESLVQYLIRKSLTPCHDKIHPKKFIDTLSWIVSCKSATSSNFSIAIAIVNAFIYALKSHFLYTECMQGARGSRGPGLLHHHPDQQLPLAPLALKQSRALSLPSPSRMFIPTSPQGTRH